MASVTSQLVVELLDRVTGPARNVSRSISTMNRKIKENSAPISMGERLNAAITRNNRALDEARGGMLDAIGTLYILKGALTAPVNAAADLEKQIAAVGTKANMSAKDLGTLRSELIETSSKVNQSTRDLAGAVDQLVGIGLDPKAATSAAETIGRVATATGASITDVTSVAGSMMQNLKLNAAGVASGFDIAAAAAKAGGFEVKDMAQYLPGLTASYEGMGVDGARAIGEITSMLQVIRTGTGDASTAANNFANLLAKVYSPTTVGKFKAANIDLMKELERGAKKGLSPVEAFIEVLREATGGDATKIGTFIEDMQAGSAARLLMQKTEQYQGIRDTAMKAQGVIDTDFATMMATAAEQMRATQIAAENLKLALGNALLPAIRGIAEALRPLLDGLADIVANHPKTVAAVTLIAGSFIGLKAALSGLRFIGLMGKGGALSMLSFAVNGLGGAMGRVGRNMGEMTRLQRTLAQMNGQKFTGLDAVASAAKGLALAAPGAGVFVSGLSGLGGILATVSAPVWGTFALAAAAIGAAGYLVWRYWDRISAVLSGAGQALGEILAPAVEKIRPVLDWFAPLGEAIARGWERAKTAVSAVGDWLGSFFQQETLTEADREAARQAGYDFIMSLWNGMKQVAEELVAWVSNLGSRLVAPIKNALSSIGSYMPSFGGAEGVTSDPAGTGVVDGARAKGGPVSRGSTYMVGERGPELITAGRSGYVNKAGPAGAGGSMTVNQSISFNISGKADEDVVDKIRRVMREEVRETFRGVFADTSMRFA